MNPEKAAEELKVIRELMQRPVRYSTRSGLSGILAGLAALGGCLADALISSTHRPREAFWWNLCVWAGVFVTAFVAVTVLTRIRELSRGMPFWSQAKQRILKTILPPFVAGVGLTLAISFRWYFAAGPCMWGLIPAVWMLFYGVACWQVGEFSIVEIRVMGAAFIVAGLLTASLQALDYRPYATIGSTFGGFHIIYGIVVWARHGG